MYSEMFIQALYNLQNYLKSIFLYEEHGTLSFIGVKESNYLQVISNVIVFRFEIYIMSLNQLPKMSMLHMFQ